MSEIRENQLTGEWVIIAPERAKRGTNLAGHAAAGHAGVPPFLATCPFCPGNEVEEDERFRITGPDGRWMVRSVVNKYSVLSTTGDTTPPHCAPSGQMSVNGVGLHEVLVESPRHDGALAPAPVPHVERVLDAYRHRFLEFSADPRVRHVIIFKNQGVEAGASQQHPHSQIVGMPIVPGQVVHRIERSWRYHAETGRCLACMLLEKEREQGCRIVAENGQFTAFLPYGALSPYHLWIFPRAHGACFATHEGLPALAEILHGILGKVYGMLGNPPYNLVIRSLSTREAGEPYFHWYLSLVPRVSRVAGFELGTGMYINPSSPEDRAQALREWSAG